MRNNSSFGFSTKTEGKSKRIKRKEILKRKNGFIRKKSIKNGNNTKSEK